MTILYNSTIDFDNLDQPFVSQSRMPVIAMVEKLSRVLLQKSTSNSVWGMRVEKL